MNINNNKNEEELNSLKIFRLLKEKILYKFYLKEYEYNINITCDEFEINLTLNEFNKITDKNYTIISECFQYLCSCFQNGNMQIRSVFLKKELVLTFFDERERNLELLFSKSAKSETTKLNEIIDYSLSDIEKIKENLDNLDINKLTQIKERKNPINIEFSSDIIKNSFANYSYESSFFVFKSINNQLELAYTTKEKKLIIYDINSKNELFKSEERHNNYITNIKHIYDKTNKMDIVMTISKKDNNIKIWNATDWKMETEITNANEKNFLYSACFLNDMNEIKILTSNGKNLQAYQTNENFENMKLFNLKGELIKEINDTNDCTYFVDIYDDKNSSKIFILTGNYNYVKSYIYETNETVSLYHKYYECNNGIHPSVIINTFERKIKLIESCEDGIIRIWGFHSGDFIRKINTDNNNLYGICLWNENYIFVGSKDQNIKLIDLKNGLIIKNLEGHNGRIISFKKIILSDNTEQLYSQGLDGKIKLWINK
jgi:WD40 repeat protein